MITGLLAQENSQTPLLLRAGTPRTAAKHATAYEKAGKAYLRSIYGNQPQAGRHVGWIDGIVNEGSVVIAEIDFFVGSPRVGVIELPLHAIKVDGITLTETAAVKSLAGRKVYVTVADRYCFDGIYLSNVTAIEFESEKKPLVDIGWLLEPAQK
ncbi:hypothetical protein RCH14_003800 [Massilia sp. MP_M2]|uniref:hypothetical protein n=1 Tax=Massilia sp. MP_M2 TaxID=3071713 RepID=UPI00319E1DD2